jgi:hypothetical protein
VAGAGGDPLVKYRLACNHPGGPPVAGAPRREWYVASRATRIDGASLARGISTFLELHSRLLADLCHTDLCSEDPVLASNVSVNCSQVDRTMLRRKLKRSSETCGTR